MLAAARLKTSVAGSPAPWLVTGLGSAAALAVAFGSLGPVPSAVLFSLAAAGGTLVTAALTRPVAAVTLAGAAGTILGDLTLFGFPALSPDQKGAAVGVITFAVGAFLHLVHVPVTDTVTAPGQPPASP